MVLANPQHKVWTYEDLLTLPDDGKRYEIIAGEIIKVPAPSGPHQYITLLLGSIMLQFVRLRKLGWVFTAPFDVRLNSYFVLQPDIVFLKHADPTRSALNEIKRIDGAPDLVVEVVSPSSQGYDRVKKLSSYATFGVPEYWIVDLEKDEILVLVLRDGNYVPFEQQGDGLIRSEVLPGLEVDLKDLFS
jgi:Uma2 family endonuclease